jgi:protocatechuate 3,4-dioxygenase beta subunit
VESRPAEQVDADGTLTIGPLPRGITIVGLSPMLLARTRIPDITVTGAAPLVDGGTITILPGTLLEVDLVDGSGAVVPKHEVFLEDLAALSPFLAQMERTNEHGRAAFEGLSAGRYLVRVRTPERCANTPMTAARVVTVPGSGTARARIITGGTAAFRFRSPYGALGGKLIVASPESAQSPPPAWMRTTEAGPNMRRPLAPSPTGAPCSGMTDGEGRVTLKSFPPGPTRIDVRLLNSRFVRRLNVPEDGRELPILIPDGFLPVRVLNAMTEARVTGATVTWMGKEGRVEAVTSATGEALLEGVGKDPGTLAIIAPGFHPGELKLSEPPDNLYEVALQPLPPTRIEVRVVRDVGFPVAKAVVELWPESPFDIPEVAVTDAKGVVTFVNLPPGSLRFNATAEGFRAGSITVAEDARVGVVLKLVRG